MPREGFYTAIDLGTTKVCTIAASVRPDGSLLVHGVGIEPAQGMSKGRVVDVGLAQAAVQVSLDQVHQDMPRRVAWAYVGVSGNHISCLNTSVVRNRKRNGTGITRSDLEELVDEAQPEVPPGKELLHHIPIGYVIDGFSGVRSPEGLDASTVEVRVHSVMGDAGPLGNVRSAVQGNKVAVRGMVLQPIAAGEAVLTEDEKEVGVALVDIGGGTSDIIVYRGGNPWYTAVLPVGGFQLTRDLSVKVGGVPYSLAEDIKLHYGHAHPEAVDPVESFDLPPFPGHPEATTVQRQDMCYALYARATEIMELVMAHLKDGGLNRMPPAGIVLTGGAAELPGMDEVAKAVFRAPARIGYPRAIPGLPTYLRTPAYSASVGILLWGIKHQGEGRSYRGAQRPSGEEPAQGLVGRLFNSVRRR